MSNVVTAIYVDVTYKRIERSTCFDEMLRKRNYINKGLEKVSKRLLKHPKSSW